MQETLNRIRGLAIKELLQLSRDKLLLLFVLLAPLLELLLMGNLRVDHPVGADGRVAGRDV